MPYSPRSGSVVLDMFGGTGTVAVVAARTGRHFIHIDISEEYCQLAKKRLATAEQLPLYQKPPVITVKRVRETPSTETLSITIRRA